MGYDYDLGVLGVGAMGAALVRGFVQRGILPADRIIVSDARAAATTALSEALGVASAADNASVVSGARALLVAVKPQVMAEVLEPLSFSPGQLVISIAAGVSLERLGILVGPAVPLIRVMPNVLATVGEASSAYAASAAASSDDCAFAERLLGAVGAVVAVPERLLDAVTGLSGSGPAFVAVFLEALIDGGVAAGLPRAEASQLAAQTVAGVGRWVLETGSSPAALKELVTSPGGTTIAGLRALEAGGLRSAALEAVVAAARRSQELGS